MTHHPRTAITGGTGFVGRHLAQQLGPGASVIISRRTGVDTSDVDALARAFEGCEVVAHCAGINREIGGQTYQRVHIEGTANVIEAAKRAGVRKVIMLSYLRARPDCGSAYHESKWAAEELIRDSGLDYTILKAGMIYGRGDHLIDHLSHTVQTLPVFATVGFREKPIRPIPIDDLTDILVAAIDGRMPRETVAVVGRRAAAALEGRAARGIRRRTPRSRGAVAGVGAVRARAGDRVDHEGAARREGPGCACSPRALRMPRRPRHPCPTTFARGACSRPSRFGRVCPSPAGSGGRICGSAADDVRAPSSGTSAAWRSEVDKGAAIKGVGPLGTTARTASPAPASDEDAAG
ncbi:SDR family oxidoreductase [Agromyces albus]|uniref:SDR family oxidoreductase n=1 Tax=Agromyces albus TaxID=205332 RepID=UPI001F51C9B8|nr:NAD(P)H-binding protein [Agromyces albus]